MLGAILSRMQAVLGHGTPGRSEVPARLGCHKRRLPGNFADFLGPGMTAPHRPTLGGSNGGRGDDASRWREAAQLRRNHHGWTVIWLAAAGEFHAYKRLPGKRRDTLVIAAIASELSAQIDQAEHAAHTTETKDE
jgi:hypothetical protein